MNTGAMPPRAALMELCRNVADRLSWAANGGLKRPGKADRVGDAKRFMRSLRDELVGELAKVEAPGHSPPHPPGTKARDKNTMLCCPYCGAHSAENVEAVELAEGNDVWADEITCGECRGIYRIVWMAVRVDPVQAPEKASAE